MKYLYMLVLFSLLSFCSLSTASTPVAPIKIVSTIKPVALIVAAIAGKGVRSSQLLPENASPHHYQLKPSDLRHLITADVIFWIGPDLEIFLKQTLHVLPETVKVEALSKSLAKRGEDAHYWLDPIMAGQMGERVHEALVDIDPENSSIYAKNLKKWKNSLKSLDASISARLLSQTRPAYILQHASLDYFEARYGLSALALLNTGAGHRGSVRNLVKVDRLLAQGKASCVLLEPVFPEKLVEQLNISKRSHIFYFDPMMNDGVSYVGQLQKLVSILAKCY